MCLNPIQQFKTDFIEDIKASSIIDGLSSSSEFVKNFSYHMVNGEQLSDEISLAYYKTDSSRNNYQVDGYLYDEFDRVLTLVFSDYSPIEQERVMTYTAATQCCKQLTNFLKAAVGPVLFYNLEFTSDIYDLVDLIRSNQKEFTKIRYFIFTNATLSEKFKDLEIETFNNIPIEKQIWTIERLFLVCVNEGRQAIEINTKDFGFEGIPCLEAHSASTTEYKSFLGMIPGKLLADIYEKYGSRLLESNVRSFLSARGKVNSSISETIRCQPKMFFAYNNGISTTAKDVILKKTSSGMMITSISDFQIINGGQTTASIFFTRNSYKVPLDDIYVQMKLTVIENTCSQEDADLLVEKIARTSNSQNKVSEADFFASSPFHKQIEHLSKTIYAPATNNSQNNTLWFYERARGQYTQEQYKLSAARKKRFLLTNPKNQLITKTDLAKVRNTWDMKPYIVSKGAQTNFMEFAKTTEESWRRNPANYNALYFQKTVALTIIFRHLEKNMHKQDWYQNAYRANIVCYTMALFHKLLLSKYPDKELNLISIWTLQDVPSSISNDLFRLANLVQDKIKDTDSNVTQWCKKENCWKEVQKIDYSFQPYIEKYLIDKNTSRIETSKAQKEQKFINEVDLQTSIVEMPTDTWQRLYNFVTTYKIALPAEITALKMACKIYSTGIVPNDIQCKKIKALLNKAIDKGFKV